MKEITLKLTIDEANLILDALGSQPFNKVYALIGKIQQQAAAELGDSGPAISPEKKKLKKETS